MSRSYNEVEALVKRAARGVNQPWGIADESAKAARWLAERGLPGPQTMVQLFELYDSHAPDKPVVDKDSWTAANSALLCPVVTGTALSDFSMQLEQHKRLALSDVACPLLLLPFLANASVSIGSSLMVHWNSVQFFMEGNRLALPLNQVCQSENQSQLDYEHSKHDEHDERELHSQHRIYADIALVTVEVTTTKMDAHLLAHSSFRERARVDRAVVNETCWARLQTFAHRTYAPASEESRRLGAGASNSDND